MNSKTIIAAITGSVASFFLGWLVWGYLLLNYYKSNTVQYEGLMLADEEMKLWAIYIAQLASAFLFAWLFQRMNISTLVEGAIAGATINALLALTMGMMYLSMMNWYKSPSVIAVDIAVNAIFGAIIGGVIGAMLGLGKKPSTN